MFGLALVDEHGAHLTAMPVEIALAVTVDVELADHQRAVVGVFDNAGVDGLALPGNVLGHAHIQ